MNTFSVREVNAPWRLQSAVLATVILLTSSCDGRIEDPARTSTDNDKAKNVSESDAALNVPLPEFEHFVVKARNDEQASKLPQTLAALLKDESRVRPLFDKVDPVNDPDEMRLMLRVSIPKQSLPSDNDWENAYWLEREANLEVAEPDEQTTLENTLEVGQLCLVDNEPPSDKGWSLKNEKAVAAWNLQPPATGKKLGEGIDVCHPDTGWTEHLDLDSSQLDLSRARNLLSGGPANARDPLEDGLLLNPGHGTGTGSVIVSGHQSGEIQGVAPRATLVPIRTAKSVIQLFDSDLARAVNYSVDAKCEVISMSLGGRTFFGLKAAIRRAVRNQLIVAAAAGNCVGFVVAPAAYDDTIAVGGTNIADIPWKGTSRGPAIDISAPAEQVWVAKRRIESDPTNGTTAGQGTSFAVANVAGGAALWLAFHGRDELVGKYAEVSTLQDAYREILRRSARVPAGWRKDQLGAGILDLEALLKTALPPAATLEAHELESSGEQLEQLAAVLGRTPQSLGPLIADLFGVSIAEVESRLEEFGPELTQLALSDPNGFRNMLASLEGQEGAPAEEVSVQSTMARGSENLRRQIEGDR